ncbi:hypothetical protein LTR37_007270 [Vermiconidia calcicola]|uniref:Uncharacterized protein n=1 Tax=Vermiconidia calcicola TaxID=1690605 RepID=A0ACC3NEC4_9PEZI|nr:hypothetical protein LTR37_007270 [Vermiconidia calcicola]
MSNVAESTQRRLQRPVHLVIDWDATLTSGHWPHMLANISRMTLVRHNLHQQCADPAVSMRGLLVAARQDYANHATRWLATNACDDVQGYCRYINSFRDVVQRFYEAIYEANLFCSATDRDVQMAAWFVITNGLVRMRAGWIGLFRLFLVAMDVENNSNERRSTITIVSSNSTVSFIRWTLRQVVRSELPNLGYDASKFLNLVDNIRIHANEIEGISAPGRSTGRLIPNVLCSSDKLQGLPASVFSQNVPSHTAAVLPWLVYVAARGSDYECLMAADSGIWLHDGPSTDVNNAFSPLSFGRMAQYPIPMNDIGPDAQARRQFLWAKTLGQVTEFLLALR